MTFQLQDDIRGISGHADCAGHPGGSDQVEGKMTLLTHTALRAESAYDAARLREVLLDPSPTAGDFAGAGQALRRSGTLRGVHRILSDRLAEAFGAVEGEIEGAEGKLFFEGLPRHLRRRET